MAAKPRVIVGVDPGTTSAVAIVSLKGEAMALRSRRDFGKREMTGFIASQGIPVIVATDRREAPAIVQKMASSFSAILYEPDEDMKEEDKGRMTKGMVGNLHERDSLAAALSAHTAYAKLLEKAERAALRAGLTGTEKVKEIVLNGEAKNIAEAIEMLSPMREENKEEAKGAIDYGYVKRLERKAERLRSFASELGVLRRELEIRSLRKVVESLRRKLEEKEALREAAEKRTLALETIMRAEAKGFSVAVSYGLLDAVGSMAKDTLVLLEKVDREALGRMISLRPRGVVGKLAKEEKETLEKAGIAAYSMPHKSELRNGVLVFEKEGLKKGMSREELKELLEEFRGRDVFI